MFAPMGLLLPAALHYMCHMRHVRRTFLDTRAQAQHRTQSGPSSQLSRREARQICAILADPPLVCQLRLRLRAPLSFIYDT